MTAVGSDNSLHFYVIIVGGGTAGIMAAAKIRRDIPFISIAVIEPNVTHYYRPGWTLVGTNGRKFGSTERPMRSVMPKNVMWIHDSVKAFYPEKKKVVTTKNNVYSYQYLIVCPGVKIDPGMVEGLPEALEMGVACSNCTDPRHTWEVLKNFRGGIALFTQPTTPVRCGSGPQQVMYWAENYFQRKKVRSKATIVLATPGSVLFAVKEVANSLEKLVRKRDIGVYFGYELVAVDALEKIAWYIIADCEGYRNRKNNVRLIKDGNRMGIRFDILYLPPPQTAPDFIRKSPLATPEGWLPVDKETLQHTTYKNIFGIGDVAELPTAKSAASIQKQVPVVSFNIKKLIQGETLGEKKYKGYAACPFITGRGKMILAEFNYRHQFTPSPQLKLMLIFNPHKAHRRLWLLEKYIFPYIYWNIMLRGGTLQTFL